MGIDPVHEEVKRDSVGGRTPESGSPIPPRSGELRGGFLIVPYLTGQFGIHIIKNRRKLPLPEEKKYAGKGVHYCELCDGHLYQDKVIAVMGGGNAAVDAANYMTKHAKKLYLVHRSKLRADESSQEKLRSNEKVEILLETEVAALKGEKRLEAIEIYDKASGLKKELAVDGIFVNIGVMPNTDMFKEDIRLAADGRIEAGEDCRTNVPGVFAAGDVRSKEVRQLTTAAADGTTAAILAEKYLAKRKGQ